MRKLKLPFICASPSHSVLCILGVCLLSLDPAVAKPGVENELRLKEGDETGNELRSLKTELLVMKSEKKALEQLLRLERKYANTRMEAEIIFRLGEIYMRRARTERFFEIHRNSEQIMTFAPQKVKEASEAAEIRKAITQYERLQTKFPRYHSLDTVIFNNAYAHQQLGDDKKAEALYRKLIEEHPHSRLVPDSYLSMGEISFKARRFQQALEHFQAVSRYPEARVYPYSLYKAAWSYYNLRDNENGIAKLEQTIEFGRKVAANGWDSKLDLRKEALGDLALFFSDSRKPSEAVDYFKSQAKELDPGPFLMRLVDIYKRHANYSATEIVLKDALTKMPTSAQRVSFHDELVWNYERSKRIMEAMASLTGFEEYCASSKPATGASNSPEGVACRKKISETSFSLASKWHLSWKKSPKSRIDDPLANGAEQAYRVHMRMADEKDTDLLKVHFTFAELLFARQRFREASALYASVGEAARSGRVVDANTSHDAAYGAVLSLERAVGDQWSDSDEKAFIALSEDYIQRHPKGPYAADLRFKRAFIAYEKGRLDEAAPLFRKIGWAEGVDGEKALKAQDLYLDILNSKKDFKAIKEASRELLNRSRDSIRSEQIGKVYREAYFSEIQSLEEQGDLVKAVEEYKKFASENATSTLAPKAWWNASQLQFRMGDASGGADTCYQMHKLFPGSESGRDCLIKAANTFESIARLDVAARVLLDLANVDSGNRDKWNEGAADFLALSGSRNQAIAIYLKLAQSRRGIKESAALLEKAEWVARESGDTRALREVENLFAARGIEPQTSRMIVEQAERAFESGDFNRAFNLAKKIIARDDLPKNLLGRARFVQARVLEDEYRKQSVKGRAERIGLVLAIKTEKLEKAQKAYQSAIRYGDPEISVKSFRRLADCYIDYARTVRGMETPPGLTKTDAKNFRDEIEQLVVPVEEKGVESMAQALEAARKAQLRSGEIAELRKEMNKLNMKPADSSSDKVNTPKIYLPRGHSLIGRISAREVQQ